MNANPLATAGASASARFKLMRPPQWTKNALLFAGFIFSGRLRQPTEVLVREFVAVVIAFAAFCLLSSATYLINDVKDLELDRAHPEKRLRPLASGQVPIATAWAMSCALLVSALALALVVVALMQTPWFLASAVAYLALTMAYSVWLKHLVIVDVMALALGFVIRVVAGCLAIAVSISSWLLLCTFNLALFMALCKRRQELVAFGDAAAPVRRVLADYSTQLLDVLIAVSASATYMSYCLYTVQAPHRDFMGGESPWLLLTVLPVFVGLGRFLYLVYQRAAGGKPEDLLRDRVIAAAVLGWIALVVTLSKIGA